MKFNTLVKGMWIFPKTLKNDFALLVKLNIYKFYVLAGFLIDTPFKEIHHSFTYSSKTGKTLSVLDGELCLPKRYIEILILSTCECDHIWKQFLCRYNWAKLRSSGWTLIQHNRFPYKKRKRQAQGRRPCEDGSRYWSYAATS